MVLRQKSESAAAEQCVAIIGLGGCFPDAPTVAQFWQNICNNHVAISQVPKERWDPELYYSADKTAPDKTYSQIGGFIRHVPFDAKRFRIMPRSLAAIDEVQKMALTVVAEALEDANLQPFAGLEAYRAFDRDRTAVIFGNSMGGEAEDQTSLRVWHAESRACLLASAKICDLSPAQTAALVQTFSQIYQAKLPQVTEDSMPGELSNCITGRIANAFDLCGPNFTTDAACASSLAAVQAAMRGLCLGEYDLAIAGGADRCMDPPSYVKFSKIGALSPDLSAPFDERANGFVMGEGVGVLILRRLADAKRLGDKIYAVVRAVGAASDGRGKAITAPNPRGQRLALQRAYAAANVSPTSIGLFEAHGTATPVGDATELQALTDLLVGAGATTSQPAMVGSVKSMIGHLKSAAGVASMIKTALALHHKILPPSANFVTPPADSPLHAGYLQVNTQSRPWPKPTTPRRAGVSAFGFGGTNFHVILEEFQEEIPVAHEDAKPQVTTSTAELEQDILQLIAQITGYQVAELQPTHLLEEDLGIDSIKQAEILSVVRQRYHLPEDPTFRMADISTIASVMAYVAKLQTKATSPNPEVVQAAKSAVSHALPSECQVLLFGGDNPQSVVAHASAKLDLPNLSAALLQERHTGKLAPTRLALYAETVDEARSKVQKAATMRPQMLAAQGVFLSSEQPMAELGRVAFVFPGQGSQYLGMLADLAQRFEVVAKVFEQADNVLLPLLGTKLTDIVWPATHNEAAELRLRQTENCQPAMLTADVAMYRLLQSFGVAPECVAGHSLGEYAAAVAAQVLSFEDALYAVSARGREMAGVKVPDPGKMAMVAADVARVEALLKTIDGYVIVANKNCHTQTVIAGETVAVEKAIALFGQSGIEARQIPVSHAFHCDIVAPAAEPMSRVLGNLQIKPPQIAMSSNVHGGYYPTDIKAIAQLLCAQLSSPVEFIGQIEHMYADGVRLFVEVGPRRALTGFVRNILGDRPHRAFALNHPKKPGVAGFYELLAALLSEGVDVQTKVLRSTHVPLRTQHQPTVQSTPLAARQTAVAPTAIGISGMAIALPSAKPVGLTWQDDLLGRLLAGENFIEQLPPALRQAMLHHRITRLDKTAGRFIYLQEEQEMIALAARHGQIDLGREYGVDATIAQALDSAGTLAMAVGLDALRDAGLPLVHHYRETSTGQPLPDRWALPTAVGERTGVIWAAAFPGADALLQHAERYYTAQAAKDYAQKLETWVNTWATALQDPAEAAELRAAAETEIRLLQAQAAADTFDRKWLLQILAMGHAQLAQWVGAQGPNTQINAACASGTQAMGLAQDWLNQNRCDRVLVVTADSITTETSLPWFGAAFLAAGAATTEASVARAAIPFGTQRNGMILGTGAAAFVVERQDAILARGMLPMVDMVTTQFANSAYHGTRLDSDFIGRFMAQAVADIEHHQHIERADLAKRLVFMSHETYTPARGGSSAAEIEALRQVFGASLKDILVANSKGYTGHPMAASFEDALAIKGLQRQVLPKVANLTDIDPAFADVQFATGGQIHADYALRFAAGFGSQMAISVYRRHAKTEARLQDAAKYTAWLQEHVGHAAGLEVVNRTLRVAEHGGVQPWELGVASLQRCGVDSDSQYLAAKPSVVQPEPVANAVLAAPTTSTAKLSSTPQLLAELQVLFAEQTGYDAAELQPDLLFEADLGIDSVKQAEIVGVVRQRYQLSADANLRFSQLSTLAHVAAYVEGHRLPTAPATTAPTSSSSSNRDVVLRDITALFAKHTGYDASELQPTHLLEADLGVDSVKQAELFGLLRTQYDLPATEALNPATLTTLNALVDFVMAHMPSQTPPPPLPTVQHDRAALAAEILTLFAQNTGYALTDLDPQHALEADLGIDSLKQTELFALLRQRYNLPADETFSLTNVPNIDAVVDYVWGYVQQAKSSEPAQLAAPLLEPEEAFQAYQVELSAPVAFAPLAGALHQQHVCLLGAQHEWTNVFKHALQAAGADVVPTELSAQTSQVIYVLPQEPEDASAVQKSVADLLASLQEWAKLCNNMTGKRLLVVGANGGAFGLKQFKHAAWLVAAAAGALKSLAKEWVGSRCLVVDMGDAKAATGVANQALAAWYDAHSGNELTWVQHSFHSLTQHRRVALHAAPLPADATVLATGGTRGITYALLRALAAKSPKRFVLLARTAGIPANQSPLTGCDEAEQKALAQAALTEQKLAATPHAIRQWQQQQKLQVEIAENIAALRAMGSEVVVVDCDLTQTKSLLVAIAEIRQTVGDIDCFLHGAGFEESKLLVDKDLSQMPQVFAPKATAGMLLWEALQPKRMITMGSVAGRFGNVAQVDYAAANELLAAMSRCGERPILNIAWTAWDDIGMATRGSTRQVLQMAGVALLPADLGVALGLKLIESSWQGDVVVAGELGILGSVKPPQDKPMLAPQAPLPLPPLFSRQEFHAGLQVLLRVFDPKTDVGLDDHRIDDVAVVPGVLGIEMMMQAATYVAQKPIACLQHVRFAVPIKIFRDTPLPVGVQVCQQGDVLQLTVVSYFTGPKGQLIVREHFTATASLTDVSFDHHALKALEIPVPANISRDDIYQRYFHGPSFQVLQTVLALGQNGIDAESIANCQPWLDVLPPDACVSAPYAREAGFQAAGLWEMVELGRMALPAAIDVLWRLAAPSTEGAYRVQVRRQLLRDSQIAFDVYTYDEHGTLCDVMQGYQTTILRDLTADERFAPMLHPQEPVPCLRVVSVAEVERLLQQDFQGTQDMYLSPAEKTRFASLVMQKRRLEWLAARIAAKQLIRETWFGRDNAIVAYSAINIERDADGAPVVTMVGETTALPRISLAHRHDVAVAFLSPDANIRPGVDVEYIEERDASFAATYLSATEYAQATASSHPATVLTQFWAIKEAVLKALGLGSNSQGLPMHDIELTYQVATDSWLIAWDGEVRQRAKALAIGEPIIEVETQHSRVLARVLLPVVNKPVDFAVSATGVLHGQ